MKEAKHEARDAAIVERYQQYEPIRQIAAAYSLTYGRVWQIIHGMIGIGGMEAVRAELRAERVACPNCGGPKSPQARLCQPCFIDYRSDELGTRRWNREKLIAAAHEWHRLYGVSPTATGWNPAMLRSRGDTDRVRVWEAGNWPHLTTVQHYFGKWSTFLEACGFPPNPVGRPARGLQPKEAKS